MVKQKNNNKSGDTRLQPATYCVIIYSKQGINKIGARKYKERREE